MLSAGFDLTEMAFVVSHDDRVALKETDANELEDWIGIGGLN